jgi:anti-sigma B factor antagonist
MEITRRFVGRMALLDLTGRLEVSPGEIEIASLRTAIGNLIAAGCVDITVNLAGLTRLDARGLGELVVSMKTLRLRGGRLSLLAPTPRVAKMLAVTGLDAVFERCDTEAQLLACDLPPPEGGCGGQAHPDATAYA